MFKYVLILVLVIMAWQPILTEASSSLYKKPKETKERLLYKNGCAGFAIVKASAYNSLPSQTDGNPWVASRDFKLKRGMKILALSSDLARCIPHGRVVKVTNTFKSRHDGFYLAVDRMHPRWRKKIDIWFEDKLSTALSFGNQKNIRIDY